MTASRLADVILLLSATCGGAIWLIVLGLGLRAAPGSALAEAVGRLRPIAAFAWRIAPMALIAGLMPAQHPHWRAVALVAIGGLGALVALFAAFRRPADGEAVTAAATVALAMSALWGDRMAPADRLGLTFPYALAALTALLAAIGGLIPRRWRVAGAVGASALTAAGAYGLARFAFSAGDLWQGAAAGCAIGAVIATLHATREDADPLQDLVTLVVAGGGVLLLVGRQFGMAGVGLAAIGLVPLAIATSTATRLAALLIALFACRSLLQWTLGVAGLGPIGLDVTRPYAFAALTAGAVLGAAPALLEPGRGRLPDHAAATALTALIPLVAVLAGAEVLPALLMGLMAIALVSPALRPDGVSAVPALLCVAGAVALGLGPRLAETGVLPLSWRMGGLAAAVAVVGLAWAIRSLTRASTSADARKEPPRATA
jgi:hypothetical protein